MKQLYLQTLSEKSIAPSDHKFSSLFKHLGSVVRLTNLVSDRMCHLTLDDLSRESKDLLPSGKGYRSDAMRPQHRLVSHPNEVLIDGIGIEMPVSSASR